MGLKKFTFDPGILIATPIAVYILADQLMIDFWMLLLAAILWSVRFPITWKW